MPQPIIPPVDPALIEDELTPDRLLRHTNKAHNLIYIVDGRECPSTMCEIGRLREIAFRAAGGGTGKECDIDEYDMMEPPCRQLIVWDPAEREILGGYRFITGPDIRLNPDGTPRIATSHMFRFSDTFVRECLPATLELGRSFVREEYQSTRAGAKALFVLDNLWDGLGALTVVYPSIKYLFGKVTMYPDYSRECRDMLLFFLHKHFPNKFCQSLSRSHQAGKPDKHWNGRVQILLDPCSPHKKVGQRFNAKGLERPHILQQIDGIPGKTTDVFYN